MSAHRAERPPLRTRLTSVRARIVAVVIGLLLLPGIAGTYAYWTDSAEVRGGGLTSGTLDLQFDGGEAAGQGTGYRKAAITWSDLTPGERKAFDLEVDNPGTTPFMYSATVERGSEPAWTYVGAPITVQLFGGSRAAEDTTYPQEESCTGPELGPSVAVGAAAQQVLPERGPLAPGGTHDICVVVGLSPDAGNDNQGRTGSILLGFTAEQQVAQ